MRILIVDDAIVFRSQIKAALDGVSGISVVAVAANGKIALDKLELVGCDVIISDLEMPEMNGIQMIREVKSRGYKQKIIVFAAPTKDGAMQAIEALGAGASDFIAKPEGVSSLEEALEVIKRELVPKILQFAKRGAIDGAASTAGTETLGRVESSRGTALGYRTVSLRTLKPRIVVIGSSTGGPVALEEIIARLKGHRLLVPILIAQHMPPHFTECLARRLQLISDVPAGEGRHGEAVVNGRIYIAPGDFHMSVIAGANGALSINLDQGPKRNFVRPAVDSLFESVARNCGDGTAAFILTGMGADGKIGSQRIKEAHGGVMIQNMESSVVWGMPGAVHEVGAYDLMGDLRACGDVLLNLVT